MGKLELQILAEATVLGHEFAGSWLTPMQTWNGPCWVLGTALTVMAGVGGAVALVVAYRRQRDLEQGRFVERFGAAAAQLGDPDAAVRLAGVYAMADVADESSEFPRVNSASMCHAVTCA